MPSHCPLHGCQASWCYYAPHMCCFVMDNSWARLHSHTKDLGAVGIPQHLSVPLIANTVFASLSPVRVCRCEWYAYVCLYVVDRCDEGPAEASLSCLPLTPSSHQCIPCPEHNGLGDSGPHCGFGWPRFRPQFSCLWDDASVYLKILQLHERCEGVLTQWLLPHLSGLFLYPRGTVGQLEAPA